jgi:hypothetical protein
VCAPTNLVPQTGAEEAIGSANVIVRGDSKSATRKNNQAMKAAVTATTGAAIRPPNRGALQPLLLGRRGGGERRPMHAAALPVPVAAAAWAVTKDHREDRANHNGQTHQGRRNGAVHRPLRGAAPPGAIPTDATTGAHRPATVVRAALRIAEASGAGSPLTVTVIRAAPASVDRSTAHLTADSPIEVIATAIAVTATRGTVAAVGEIASPLMVMATEDVARNTDGASLTTDADREVTASMAGAAVSDITGAATKRMDIADVLPVPIAGTTDEIQLGVITCPMHGENTLFRLRGYAEDRSSIPRGRG